MPTDCQRLLALLLLGLAAVLAQGASPPDGPSPADVDARKDAVQLRKDADDIEKRLGTSGLLYGQLELDAYLQGVADALHRPEDPSPIRVRVIKGPWPNAFVLPNGASYVTTAMLDMLDNEAQLACVLGHEMTHLVEQHALQEMRAQRTRQGWATALAVLVGAVGAYYGGSQAGAALADLTASAGQLWTISAVSGYSRDNEREADRVGFERLVDAGYDTAQAPLVFELLLARTPDEDKGVRPYFATHPRLEERIASFRELAAARADAPAGKVEAERYLVAIGELPIEQALLLIEGDRPMLAQSSIDRYLAHHPDSARAHFVTGEMWRARPSEPGAIDNALAAYDRAAALPGTPPAALRNKGLLHRERGELPLARQAFEKYLALDPGAVDAGIVRLYLQELSAAPP
jgi:predicted Zn-dependent protease